MKFLCTYRILVIDADDAADAVQQARACAADSAEWEVEESTADEVES